MMETTGKTEMPHTGKTVTGTIEPFINLAPDRKKSTAQTGKQWSATVYNDYTVLEEAWRQLESCGNCSVFQGYDCASSWYAAAASCGAAKPLVVVVSKENGGIAWILPLCISHHKNLKIIGFADLGVADYAAPLIAPGAPSDHNSVMAILQAVFAALPPCDIVNFQKLVPEVQGIHNPLLYLRGLERFPVGAHGIRITEPWPELAPKIMQRRMYSTIVRKREKLEKKAVIAIEHCDTPETMEPALERLIAMRDARFKKIGLPEMPTLWKNYYRNLVTRGRGKLQAEITTLTIDGDPVATNFGLTCGKTYYALLSTFKMEKWSSYRPGLQLFYITLTDFAEQTGYDGYYDFTIGDEGYKSWFGGDDRILYEWMAPRSLKGIPYYLAWQVKSFVRQHPPIFAALQKLLLCLRAAKEKRTD